MIMHTPGLVSAVWLKALKDTLMYGTLAAPRRQEILELPAQTHAINMLQPVITIPARKLNYRFMTAAAYWMLTGDDRVETIAPYNPHISQWSDDGQVFFGAYGPKVHAQLPYVIDKLREDPSSRQAGLTIWRESPPRTKDVPCTVAMFFTTRGNQLNANIFMRASDIWLGLPYDIFDFSILATYICAILNSEASVDKPLIIPGTLYLTAATSHVYRQHWDLARQVVAEGEIKPSISIPSDFYKDPFLLRSRLSVVRNSAPGDASRWWEEPDHETE